MSGPKYSSVDLVAIEKRRLEEERAREIARKKMEYELRMQELKRKALEDRIAFELDRAIRQIDKLSLNIENSISQLNGETKQNAIFEQLEKLLCDIKMYQVDLSGDEKELIAKKLLTQKDIKDFKDESETLLRELRQIQEDLACVEIRNSKIGIARERDSLKIEASMGLDEFYLVMDEVDACETMMLNDKENIVIECQNLKRLLEHSDGKNLANLRKIKRNIEVMLFNAKKKYSRMCDMYDEYIIWSMEANIDAKELNDFASVQQIEKEIILLKESVYQMDKLDYISNAIHDVMEEFGHSIIRSDVMKKASMTKNIINKELYEFDEDGGINVLLSDDGAIVMEVVATGDSDDFGEQEKQQNVEKMISFCQQYPEMIKRLEEKGIVFSNREDMPPCIDFAKKVVVDRKSQDRVYPDKKHANQQRRRNGQLQTNKKM